jgi:hypothetical protein
MNITMTHDRYGGNTQDTNGTLTHRISSNDSPHPDGGLKNTVRTKIIHYRQIYVDKPDPITFLSVTVSTSVRVCDQGCVVEKIEKKETRTLKEVHKAVHMTVECVENYIRTKPSFVDVTSSLVLTILNGPSFDIRSLLEECPTSMVSSS